MSTIDFPVLVKQTNLFNSFESGDEFRYAGTYAIEVDDDTFGTNAAWVRILETIWEIGNRQGADAHGRCWPSFIRSLSVGDAVVTFGMGENDAFGEAVVNVVEPAGWKPYTVKPTYTDNGIRLTVVREGQVR